MDPMYHTCPSAAEGMRPEIACRFQKMSPVAVMLE